MNIYVPNYYQNFKCIADRCQHNCCIGWEIDIDEDALKFYSSLNSIIGDQLKNSISYKDTPHFTLTHDDRCPFLNDKGLCDLICNLGKDALCNICRDHPRFRNFYSSSEEIGLGLCCEAASDLILKTKEPFCLVKTEGTGEVSYTEKETYVLNTRNKYIEIIKDRQKSIQKRHNLLLNEAGADIPYKSLDEWCDFFLGLERLDNEWSDVLTKVKMSGLKNFYLLDDAKYQIPLEQLTIYFLYRHMPLAIFGEETSLIAKFCVFSTQFIYTVARAACDGKSNDLWNTFLNVSRMYSAEIEYSDENLETVFDELY